MSINSALLSGVSGLIANSSSLAAISDNIANVNTVGYKRSTANFSTLVTAQSKNSTYSAGGVKALTHQFITQQGLTQSSTSNLDLSIAGNGFFVTTEKPENLTATDTRSFTRAGSFQLDNLGYLKNDAGLYLQGWLADPVTGDILTDPSDLTKLASINVGTVGGTADMTTRAAINANLRSEQPLSGGFAVAKKGVADSLGQSHDLTVVYTPNGTADNYDVEVREGSVVKATGTAIFDSTVVPPTLTSTTVAGPVTVVAAPAATVPLSDLGLTVATSTANLYDPTNNTMADYAMDQTLATPAGDGVKPDFEIQLPVSDSKGGQRTITLSLLKGPAPNEWYAELRARPGDLAVPTNGLVGQGIITFTQDGKLKDTGTLFGAAGTNLTIEGSDPLSAGTAPRWADGLGIGLQTVQIDLASASGGLTQFNSQSVVQSVNTNGTAFGNLTNIEVDDEGYVSAIFDNGVTRSLAKVALATFSNANGLKGVNGNAYRVTNESGTYSLKAPGSGGAGVIAPSTLEASTVDLSTEFTGLITTQRAYSASSKIITTADQMLEELLNIKR